MGVSYTTESASATNQSFFLSFFVFWGSCLLFFASQFTRYHWSSSFPSAWVGRGRGGGQIWKWSWPHQSKLWLHSAHPYNPCSCLQDICRMPPPSCFCSTFGAGALCEAVLIPLPETHRKALPLQLSGGEEGSLHSLPSTSSPGKFGFFMDIVVVICLFTFAFCFILYE